MGNVRVEIDKNLDITIHTLEGAVTYTETRDAIDKYYKGTLTKYTIWDFSKASQNIQFTFDELRALGSQTSKLGKARPEGYDLIIVSNVLDYGFARVYSGYSQVVQTDGAKAMVFHSREEALKWIIEKEAFKSK